MSVAIFTDNDFDKTNGVTTTLRALLRYAPPDVRTRVYTLSDIGLDRHDYLALRSLSAPIPYYTEMRMYVPRMRALARHLAADRVSLIHTTTPGPMGLAARYFGSRAMRLVGSFHTNLSEYAELLSGSTRLGAAMGSYMRWLYGRCETVFVPSHDTRGRLLARQWPSDRLRIWRRGVDTETFSPARRSAALREAWGVSDRRPALIYVGRVSREKGLDLLPTIESILRCGTVCYRLIVVGDGPMSAELRERCPDAYFTGTLPHDEVATAMASSDVMVFPSETDTAGNVVLEAQSCGLPIVVSDAGGPQENIRHGETGYVCRSGDAIDFARRVGDFLRNPEWRAASARAARAFAGERSWQSALQPVYSLYRSIAGSTAPVTDEADAQMPATPQAV